VVQYLYRTKTVYLQSVDISVYENKVRAYTGKHMPLNSAQSFPIFSTLVVFFRYSSRIPGQNFEGITLNLHSTFLFTKDNLSHILFDHK